MRTTAQASGFPHMAVVSVPHPIGGLEAVELKKKADDALENVIEILNGLCGNNPR